MKLKTGALLRIVAIGSLHTVLYLWLVPCYIYPRFGDSGLKMAVAVAVLISVGLLGTLFFRKSGKR